MMKRRKFGGMLSGPIEEFIRNPAFDRLIFIEKDHAAAQKTRAAVGMYIWRNDLDLTTSVRDDEIWVLKDKDAMDESITVDLRMNEDI